MQVSLQRPYHPPKLGFIPPPPIRPARMGTSFPASTDVPQSNLLRGFESNGVTGGILIAGGGAAISYFSRFFPGVGEPIALVGGLGLMGLGVYKFYNDVTGASEPASRTSPIPPGQVAEDVYQLQAKIVKPIENSKAELSNLWSSLFVNQLTFKISFSITNPGKKPVTPQVTFHTTESTRPLFGKADSVDFETNYIIPDLMPGETRNVDGNHPFEPLLTLSPIDIMGTLILKASEQDHGVEIDWVHFTAGG